MLRSKIGQILASELDRIRAVNIRRQAFDQNPRAYSATEGEQIYMAMTRVEAEVLEMFDIDETRIWKFSSLNGVVYYEDD